MPLSNSFARPITFRRYVEKFTEEKKIETRNDDLAIADERIAGRFRDPRSITRSSIEESPRAEYFNLRFRRFRCNVHISITSVQPSAASAALSG